MKLMKSDEEKKKVDANERYLAVYIAVDPSSKKASSSPPPTMSVSRKSGGYLIRRWVLIRGYVEGDGHGRRRGVPCPPSLPYDKAGEADRECRASFV